VYNTAIYLVYGRCGRCVVYTDPPQGPLHYRCAVYRYQKNIAVLKVTVLYTVGLLNTAVYRPAVLIFNKLSSLYNLFHFVHCVLCYASLYDMHCRNPPRCLQKWGLCVFYYYRIHRIHRRQHAFTDDTGMSKHRLSPYNAYYHN